MKNLEKIKSLGTVLTSKELSFINGMGSFHGVCNNGSTFTFNSNHEPGDAGWWGDVDTANALSCNGSGMESIMEMQR